METDNACASTSGTWVSPYDGEEWTDASDVDIDHMVPLSNAWKVRALALPPPPPPRAFVPQPSRPLMPNQLPPPAVRRLLLDKVQARGLCQRHRRAAALGRHRRGQPGQGRQGPRGVEAATGKLPLHLRQELGAGQERLRLDGHGGREGGAFGHAGLVLGEAMVNWAFVGAR